MESGRKLFAGACGACHGSIGEGGHGLGLAKGVPGTDMLSDIGATRTLRQLRETLLDPSARIQPDFRAVTADAREIQGVAKNCTNYSLSIRDAKGELLLRRKEPPGHREEKRNELNDPAASTSVPEREVLHVPDRFCISMDGRRAANRASGSSCRRSKKLSRCSTETERKIQGR